MGRSKDVGVYQINSHPQGQNNTRTALLHEQFVVRCKTHWANCEDHWGVENKLHWHLDVSFGEDLCKIRTDHAAENFSLVKKMALGLLKADTSEKLGVPNKRKLAGWSPEYLLKILGVK